MMGLQYSRGEALKSQLAAPFTMSLLRASPREYCKPIMKTFLNGAARSPQKLAAPFTYFHDGFAIFARRSPQKLAAPFTR